MPLESTGTTDFDEAAFPDAIRFWMKVKDAEPPKPVRIIVTAGALEEIDLALDQYGRVEIFKKHRASIEAAASDKFDKNRLRTAIRATGIFISGPGAGGIFAAQPSPTDPDGENEEQEQRQCWSDLDAEQGVGHRGDA